MKIAAQQAQIKTAQVEIKALMVSGKQVTLAVFRQLESENLIDPETLQLRGIPWGHINYHPDRCEKDSEHLHVLWQKDSELRRDKVSTAPPFSQSLSEKIETLNDLGMLWVKIKTLRGWTPSKEEKSGSTRGLDDIEVTTDLTPNVFGITFPLPHWPGRMDDGYWLSRAWAFGLDEQIKDELQAESVASYDVADLEAKINQVVKACADRRAAYEKRYVELASLDQIFIAT